MTDQATMARQIMARLHAHGATFALSPGSRSTPLVLHLPNRPHPVIHDERALGFFGIGLARTGALPVLVTTSGTAVANLLPAVVEAKQDQLPLILLTADRPESEYDSGANQTIKQVGIFSHFVVDSLALDAEKSPDIEALIDRAVDAAKRGPVHINVHLRKPLEHVAPATTADEMKCGGPTFLEPDFPDDIDILLIGKCSRNEAIVAADFAKRNRIPAFFDVQSGALGFGNFPLSNLVHDPRLDDAFSHAFVVGSRFTEHRIWSFLRDNVERVTQSCREAGRFDPLGVVTDRRFPRSCSKASDWSASELETVPAESELLHRSIVQSVFGASCAKTYDNVFLGNSLVIRAFDRFRPKGVSFGPQIFANRGASGIDGNLATAAGIAKSGSTLCVVGDQTFLHDAGSIASFADVGSLRIVVIDNSGGRIFEHLPVLPEQQLERYFVNRGVDVADVARAFTRRVSVCESTAEFGARITQPIDGLEVIVARVDPTKDLFDFRRPS